MDFFPFEEQLESIEGEEQEEEEDRNFPEVRDLDVVEVRVDRCLELGLVALIVKFKELAILLSLTAPSQVGVVVLVALRVHHLDFVVEQAHRGYLLPQLEPPLALVELPRLGEVREEDVDHVGVVVKFQDTLIQLTFPQLRLGGTQGGRGLR
jgi:hypothetical protein